MKNFIYQFIITKHFDQPSDTDPLLMTNSDTFDQTPLTVPIDRQLELILRGRSTRPSTLHKDIEHGENAVDPKDNEKGLETSDG